MWAKNRVKVGRSCVVHEQRVHFSEVSIEWLDTLHGYDGDMSSFYTESDIVTYQNNLIIYMWDRKETIIPEKQTTRKPE